MIAEMETSRSEQQQAPTTEVTEEEMRSRVGSTAQNGPRRRRQQRQHQHEGLEACSRGIPITGSSPAPKRTCLLQPGTCSSPHPLPDRVHAGRWMNIAPRGEKVRKPEFD